MENDWVFGQRRMSLLSLVFLRGFRDAQSERRLPLCLESLSLTSSIFVRAFRLCGIWLLPWFCAVLWRFVFMCRFCTFVAFQDIVHRWEPTMAYKVPSVT
jgi:hypothetical protein